MSANNDNLRIDKWLWAARFFKTRSLASDAVNGGKVHLNNDRVKAARAVKVGDEVRIRRGQETYTVVIMELSSRRGPAPQAQKMYEESEASIAAREREKELRKFAGGMVRPDGKPSKQDRRQLHELKRKNAGN